MLAFAFAAAFALLVWWFGTGAVLYVDGMPQSTHRRTMVVATALGLGGALGIWATREATTIFGAYIAFSSALMVWAWHELSFLMGWLTGPRREPCPSGAEGWKRFTYATEVVLHHEIALALTLAAVAWLTASAPNPIATWTFAALWVMRLSAKLNLFLGVRNTSEAMIPMHLRYITTYFRRASFNPLMPWSLLIAAGASIWVIGVSFGPHTSAHASVGGTLVATLLGLALLEHVLMAFPIRDPGLWRWAMRTPRSN